MVRYELQKRQACDLLTVFETDSPLYAFAAGWFYGGVPIRTQLKIDRAILNLRLHDKIQELVRRFIDTKMSLNCAPPLPNISPRILSMPLLIMFIVFMIPVAASVLYVWSMRRREKAAFVEQNTPTETGN